MSAAELLPCPFCGDTLVHLVERVYDGSHPELQRSKYCFVECVPNDHRTGSFYENDAEMMGIDKTMQQLAIEDWNRRVAPLASAPAGSYDEAVAAIATYLPDGWVAQDESGRIFRFDAEPTINEEHEFWLDDHESISLHLNFPRCLNWRTSLRRIESGRVIPAHPEAGRMVTPSLPQRRGRHERH